MPLISCQATAGCQPPTDRATHTARGPPWRRTRPRSRRGPNREEASPEISSCRGDKA